MSAMSTRDKAARRRTRLLTILRRLAMIVALGICVAWALNRASAALERSHRPAGFVHGVVQGALMPLAMPNLLAGNDVTIYSVNNTGRWYKLGYTFGVTACGLIFFGFGFWRVKRLMKHST